MTLNKPILFYHPKSHKGLWEGTVIGLGGGYVDISYQVEHLTDYITLPVESVREPRYVLWKDVDFDWRNWKDPELVLTGDLEWNTVLKSEIVYPQWYWLLDWIIKPTCFVFDEYNIFRRGEVVGDVEAGYRVMVRGVEYLYSKGRVWLCTPDTLLKENTRNNKIKNGRL